jgi:AcrR family transcriptional regulator
MAPIPDDPLGDQILAAAALVFAEAGVRGATLDAVAERAHVSPQTVRRRWTGKLELALAMIDRDLCVEPAEVDRRMAGLATIAEKIVEGATSVYWFLHTHPLVGGALVTDLDLLWPRRVASGCPVVAVAAAHVVDAMSGGEPRGRDAIADPDALTEVLSRLIHSLLLSPSATAPLTSHESTAAYMRRCVVPLVRAAGT